MNSPPVPPPASLSAEAAAFPAQGRDAAAIDTPSFRPNARGAARRTRVSLLASYLRSQLAAAVATAVDFAVMIALVEALGVHYLPATAAGAISGGVTAFVVNRHWSFIANHAAAGEQALRYALVWIGSISLNCLLVYLLTDQAGWAYTASKAVTAVTVGGLFNFPMHRYFVFR